MADRVDETWHRLRQWTGGSSAAERLAGQLLAAERFVNIDPSHPLGGPDDGRDLTCDRDEMRWIAAVYFPRGQRPFQEVRDKFKSDVAKARAHQDADGFVFITNQELRLAERAELSEEWEPGRVLLLHLERVASILDRPNMNSTREQYLGIEQERKDGEGGTGGGANVVGDRGLAIGGRGGRGGVGGHGGNGGSAEVMGHDALAIGGDGGDAGSADGRGGRGTPSPLEIEEHPALTQPPGLRIPTEMWGAGRGGQGGNHPEYDRRLVVLIDIKSHYGNVFPERMLCVNAGIDRVSTHFINSRLEELGEEWRVTMGLEGYELPPLSDDPI